MGVSMGEQMNCGVRGCEERVVGGFQANRNLSTLDRDGILPASRTCWCKEHETALRYRQRGAGSFFDVNWHGAPYGYDRSQPA
jgi:hypothetical protein